MAQYDSRLRRSYEFSPCSRSQNKARFVSALFWKMKDKNN